jgi:hypothetical protein
MAELYLGLDIRLHQREFDQLQRMGETIMNIPAFLRLFYILKPHIYKVLNLKYYSVVDLVGRTGSVSGEKIHIDSYYAYGLYPNTQRGGAKYVWKSTQAKSTHNGITIISPTVPWDGTAATTADFRAKTGETSPGGTGCWMMEYDELNILMAGAITGFQTAFDNAPVIQACLSVATGTSTSVVVIPEYVFWVNSTIESADANRTLKFSSYGGYLHRTGDYGDTFYFHGTAGAALHRVTIEKPMIVSGGLTTSGAHFHMEGCLNMRIVDPYVQDGFIFFKINGCSGNIDRVYCNMANLYGGTTTGRKYFEFGDAAGYAHPSCSDLFISDANPRAPASGHNVDVGIDILSGDGIWFTGGHSGYAQTATVRFNPSGSSVLNLIFFDNFMFDWTTGIGTLFDGSTTGVYADIYFDGCKWTGANTAVNGFKIASGCNVYSVHVNGGSLKQFAQDGVVIESTVCGDINFNNLDVAANSKASSNTYSGYKLANNVSDVRISGGRSGGGDNDPADADTQKYGVDTGTGHSGVYVDGVDLSGNITGATNATSSTSGVSITGCLGVDAVGTLTPTMTLGGGSTGMTFLSRGITYKRRSDEVSFSLSMFMSSKGSSTGDIVIGNLPYTSANTATFPVSLFMSNVTSGVGDTHLFATVQNNSKNIFLYKMISGVATRLKDTDITDTTEIRINGRYPV